MITKDTICPPEITFNGKSCLVIDGQALLVSLGKPSGVTTFGELGDAFLKCVLEAGRLFDRIDVVFDQYRETSIKTGTRNKRS